MSTMALKNSKKKGKVYGPEKLKGSE